MSERPIIFDSESVRGILAGTKTQTRRVIKPQPEETYPGSDIWMLSGSAVTNEYVNPVIGSDTLVSHYFHDVDSPYGGGEYADGTFDRLWVREVWGFTARVSTDGHEQWMREQNTTYLIYRATETKQRAKWRSSIHMPRWASRITLQVADVRVERLQSISEIDCEADLGLKRYSAGSAAYLRFMERWDAINAKRGWPWWSNPWVWVVEFQLLRVEE